MERQVKADVPDIVVAAGGTEFDRNVLSKDLFEDFKNFQTKPGTVFFTAAPLICTMVGSGIEELMDDVSVSSMYYRGLDLRTPMNRSEDMEIYLQRRQSRPF